MKHVAAYTDSASARILLCFLATALLVLGMGETGLARSEEKDMPAGILAVGTASVKQGNLTAAKRQALADALKNGVEEYLLRRLGGKIVAGRLARFVQDLVPAAQNEIANFNILGGEEVEGTYRVLVRFQMNEQTLEKTLQEKGFLLTQGPSAKILFMVSQHSADSSDSMYWWKEPESGEGLTPVELSLNRTFESLGFSLAGRAMEAPEGENAEALQDIDLAPEEASEWGRICSADVVVTGSCVLGDGLVSLHLQAVDVASASVLAKQRAQASLDPGLKGSKRTRRGIEQAVEMAAEPLADGIRETFQRPESDSKRISLTLEGVGSFTLIQQFTRFLQNNIPGVASVTQTGFKGDTVMFSIDYPHGAERLLQSLLNRPEPPFAMSARRNESGEIVVAPL